MDKELFELFLFYSFSFVVIKFEFNQEAKNVKNEIVNNLDIGLEEGFYFPKLAQ
jgi:hypothetical protein